MDSKTLDEIREMVAAGKSAGDVERFCGKQNVEFHPLACAIVNGIRCLHMGPGKAEAARAAFDAGEIAPDIAFVPEPEPAPKPVAEPTAAEPAAVVAEASVEETPAEVAEPEPALSASEFVNNPPEVK